ncbi:hypothetical protein HDU86_003255 [Geranomyces michiganensis]|nr:hypothetical protein HDU86_003255 [Geranomyces michiganensis]
MLPTTTTTASSSSASSYQPTTTTSRHHHHHHHHQRIRTLCCPPLPANTPHPLLAELPHRAANGLFFSLVCTTTGRTLLHCHNCRALFAAVSHTTAAAAAANNNSTTGARCPGCGALTITDESLAAACSLQKTDCPRISALHTVAIQTCLAGATEYIRVKTTQRAELLHLLDLKRRAFWKAKFAKEALEETAVARATSAGAAALEVPTAIASQAPPPLLPAPPIIVVPAEALQPPPQKEKGKKPRKAAALGKDAISQKHPPALRNGVGNRNKDKTTTARAAAAAGRRKDTAAAASEVASAAPAPVLTVEEAQAAATASAAAAPQNDAESTTAAADSAAVQDGGVQSGAKNGCLSMSTSTKHGPGNNTAESEESTSTSNDAVAAAKEAAVPPPPPTAAEDAPQAKTAEAMDLENNPVTHVVKKNRRKKRAAKTKDAQADEIANLVNGSGGDPNSANLVTTPRANKGKRPHPGSCDPQAESNTKRRRKNHDITDSGGVVVPTDSPGKYIEPELSMEEIEGRVAVCDTLLEQLADPRALHSALVDVTPTCDVAFTSWDLEV